VSCIKQGIPSLIDLNEARSISNLDHPNIATVHAIEEFEDTIFICLGYYEGETLKELLDRGYKFSTEEIYSIIEQIALGLKEAHEAGVIHRDIKPANIFLTQNKQVKILDFGLSKMHKSIELTQPNVVMGTASYMAPEQIVGEKVSQQSDLFSFGCVMYEIITGNKPFPGYSSLSVSYAIMNSQPESIRSTREEIPNELEAIVQKALEKRPESRYQSAAEILDDLSKFKGSAVDDSPKRGIGIQTKIVALAAVLIVVGLFIFNKITPVKVSSITVLPFYNETMPEDWNWVSPVLEDLVITNLDKSGNIRVLNPKQKDNILKSLNLKGKELSKGNALKIAQKAKTQSVLIGRLKKENNQIAINATLLDSQTGNAIKSYENIKTEPAQLAGLASNLSEKILNTFNLQEKSKNHKKNADTDKTISLEAYRYYIEGVDAAYDLRHKESIEKLSKAIEIDSTFIKAYFHLSHSFYEMGETEKAKSVLHKGKPYLNDLSEIDRLEYLCNEAAFDSRWQNYMTYLEKLKQLNPHDASVFYRYGWVQYKKFNQLDAGIQAMERSLQIDSTYSRAYNALGYAYLRNGEPTKAMGIINTFIRLNPTDINPRDSKAEFLMLTGKYQEAYAECEYILMMRPDFMSTPILVTEILIAQGKLEEAQQTIDDYLERSLSATSKSQAQTVKANIHYQKNELFKADSVINVAIENDSINFEAQWMQGIIALKVGRLSKLEETMTRLNHYLAREGGFDGRWFLYHLQGEYALTKGQYEKAIEQFSNAVKLGPKNRSFFLTVLAKAHILNEQYEEAISYLKLFGKSI